MNKILLIPIIYWLLFSVFTQVSYGRPSGEECGFIPSGWSPDLGQVGESLQETAKRGATQQESAEPAQLSLNLLSQNMADLRDAELFIAYVQFAQRLDNHHRHRFCLEQKRWLAKRDAEAEAAAGSSQGSITAALSSDAFRKITEERVYELRMRLNQSNTITKPKVKNNK